MATCLVQLGFTQKGVKKIKESPARVEAAKQTIRNLGGEVKAFYGILSGECDTLFIIEAPNEQKAGEMGLAIAVLGYVRTRTHRIFREDEFKATIASLP